MQHLTYLDKDKQKIPKDFLQPLLCCDIYVPRHGDGFNLDANVYNSDAEAGMSELMKKHMRC